ncbi:L,D-transpeptidase family protein [Flavisolibacter sp. BT320]|nr:L,D-transpeptidase family protein [Flavisolibacter longurius]
MKKMMIGIVAVGLLTSCQQVQGWFGSSGDTDSTMTSESANKAKMLRDESITRENAYSDLFVDSAALEAYIQKEKVPADKADRMREFYIVRSNQFAWFTSDGMTEQARGLWSLSESSAETAKTKPSERLKERMDSLLTKDSAAIARQGSSPIPDTATRINNRDTATQTLADSAVSSLRTAANDTTSLFSQSDTALVQTELALTAHFVALATETQGPITADNFYWLVPRKKMDAMQLADSLLHKPSDSTLWQNNAQYAALKNSLATYYNAAKNGGWSTITSTAGLQKGTQSPAVVQLKKRLAASGDYVTTDTSNIYSDSLMMAVRTLQERYGLHPTGIINDTLVAQLNVPAEQRVQQILVNMNRALWLAPQTDSSRIMINIPAQQLVVYSDSGKVMTMPVIVGKEGTGTMAFNDEITTVVFNPYWNIPESIVKNEIMPAMKKDPNYLKKNNMEIVSQNDSIPQIRQLPGKDNALGRVKFLFPNSFDIYLHDTPNKALFAQQNRALSHGCIRVAKPDSLALFVLRGQDNWTLDKINAAMNAGKEQSVGVKTPVPVSISYYTAWADPAGKLHFSRDIYGYDQRTAERMFASTALPPSVAKR